MDELDEDRRVFIGTAGSAPAEEILTSGSGQLRLFPEPTAAPSSPPAESSDTLPERARWVAVLKENIDDVRVGRQAVEEQGGTTADVMMFAVGEILLTDILDEMTGERYP